MPVKVLNGARYITLGRCLFLFVSSLALAGVIAYLLSSTGVPRTINLFGWVTEWSPFLSALIFTAAFRAFSLPAEGGGAA